MLRQGPTGWNLQQGAFEAAKADQKLIAIGNGQCWLPDIPFMSPAQAKARSAGPPNGTTCTGPQAPPGTLQLYELTDEGYHTLRRIAGNEEWNPVDVRTVREPSATLRSHGCWADRDTARIIPGRAYDWDTTGCAVETAKRRRRVFGMESGSGRCWIPESTDTTVQNIKQRSGVWLPNNCAPEGSPGSMNVHDIPDGAYEAIRAYTNVDAPPVSVNLADGSAVLSHGCWRNGNAAASFGEYGWNAGGCAYETVRRGRRTFGMQANRCYIPVDDATTALTVKENAGQRVAAGATAGCNEGGGNDSSMNVYEIPDATYQRMRNQLALDDPPARVRLDHESQAGVFLPVWSYGCWKDPNNEGQRIVAGDSFGWGFAACAGEAARRDRRVFGMEAGGQCWIPSSDATTPMDVMMRSGTRLAPPGANVSGVCEPGGAANSLHLYRTPDESFVTMRRSMGQGDVVLLVDFTGESVTAPTGWETRPPKGKWVVWYGTTHIIYATDVGPPGHGNNMTWGPLGVPQFHARATAQRLLSAAYVLGLQGYVGIRYPLKNLSTGQSYVLAFVLRGRGGQPGPPVTAGVEGVAMQNITASGDFVSVHQITFTPTASEHMFLLQTLADTVVFLIAMSVRLPNPNVA